MPGAVSFPYCPERKLNTVSLPAEYGLHMLLFSSDLKPVIIELNSCTLLYLPVNRFYPILFQKLIRLTERPASEESPIRGQRTRMRRRQNQVLWIVEH